MKNIINNLISCICVAVVMNSTLIFASSNTDIIKEIIQHKLTKDMKAVGVSIAIVENDRDVGKGFDVVDESRLAEQPHLVGKWRLR